MGTGNYIPHERNAFCIHIDEDLGEPPDDIGEDEQSAWYNDENDLWWRDFRDDIEYWLPNSFVMVRDRTVWRDDEMVLAESDVVEVRTKSSDTGCYIIVMPLMMSDDYEPEPRPRYAFGWHQAKQVANRLFDGLAKGYKPYARTSAWTSAPYQLTKATQ